MRPAVVLLASALSLSSPATAQTDGIQVTPVVIAVAPERGMASVRVRNWREREVSFEVNVYAWNQRDGADVYTPATDVIAAPSVFALPAGGEQIVRLGLTSGARTAPDQEIAYRLMLRELPAPDPTGGSFRVQLQMSLPVFVQPRATYFELEAQRVSDANASHGVVITNTGSAHVRLSRVTYGGGAQPIERLPRYLLAGSSVARALPADVDTIEITYAGAGATTPATATLRLDAPAHQPHLR